MEGQPGTNYFGKLNKFVNISQTNEFGFGVIADCFGDPNVVAADVGVFNNGCLMFRNDILTGNSIYENTGTLLSPSWVLVGSGGTTTSFVDNEIVAQTSSLVYTLANTPIAGSEHVFGGGSRLYPGSDYTIAGRVITVAFTYGATGVLADYRK